MEAARLFCNQCGFENPDRGNYCWKCGAALFKLRTAGLPTVTAPSSQDSDTDAGNAESYAFGHSWDVLFEAEPESHTGVSAETQRLSDQYKHLDEEEIMLLALQASTLTSSALSALRQVINSRGITAERLADYKAHVLTIKPDLGVQIDEVLRPVSWWARLGIFIVTGVAFSVLVVLFFGGHVQRVTEFTQTLTSAFLKGNLALWVFSGWLPEKWRMSTRQVWLCAGLCNVLGFVLVSVILLRA